MEFLDKIQKKQTSKHRIILSFLIVLFACQIELGRCMEKETLSLPADRVFNHAPSLLELPDGTLLVAWYSGSKEKSRDNAILLSFKKPDSKEWSNPQILVDTPNRADGNPVLFFLDSKIYCFYSSLWGTGWSTAQLFCTKTKLDGNNFSWTSPQRIFPFYRMGDLGRGKPVILDNKEFILPLYKEFSGYYSYVCKFREGKMVYQSPLLRSKPGNLQPAIILISDGDLLMLMRPEKGGCFWQSFSKDNGKTWDEVVKREDLPNPGSGFDILRLISGKIILVFNDNPKTRNNLTIALSEDEGRSFPIRKILEKEENVEFSYPSVIQDSKGKIHIVYSVNKEEIRHIILAAKDIYD